MRCNWLIEWLTGEHDEPSIVLEAFKDELLIVLNLLVDTTATLGDCLGVLELERALVDDDHAVPTTRDDVLVKSSSVNGDVDKVSWGSS